MNQKTNFIHVHEAALLGLPKRIACDQALAGCFEGVHCLDFLSDHERNTNGNGAKHMVRKFDSEVAHDHREEVQAEQEDAVSHLGPLPRNSALVLGYRTVKGDKLGLARLMDAVEAEFLHRRRAEFCLSCQSASLAPSELGEIVPQRFNVDLSIHLRIINPSMDSRQLLIAHFYG